VFFNVKWWCLEGWIDGTCAPSQQQQQATTVTKLTMKLDRRKFGKRQASNDAVQSAAEERVKETSNRVYQLVASPLHLRRNLTKTLGG
jgi:hypothetical protein